MKYLTKHLFFGLSLFSAWPAFGAIVGLENPSYEQGDLVLSFQNPGGVNGATQTLMVNLGNSATVFRDAQADRLNIINIGTTLATTFGSGTLDWWEATTLYVHVAAVRGTSALGAGLVNGDPERTLYISRPRNGLGTAGFANSNAWEILGNTDMTNGAADINVMGNVLETQYTTGVAVSPTNVSQVDDHNPFIQAGLQGTAYRIFPGGVQQGFAPGPFGNFGAAGEVEAGFDLYRIQARNDRPGQFGEGQANRIGAYEGTITIDRDGDVSFIVAIPEPTIGGFLAAALLVLGSGRRRPEVHYTRRAAIAGEPHRFSDNTTTSHPLLTSDS